MTFPLPGVVPPHTLLPSPLPFTSIASFTSKISSLAPNTKLIKHVPRMSLNAILLSILPAKEPGVSPTATLMSTHAVPPSPTLHDREPRVFMTTTHHIQKY